MVHGILIFTPLELDGFPPVPLASPKEARDSEWEELIDAGQPSDEQPAEPV